MRLINVMGASVDGRIAASPDESDADRQRYGFTNDADRRHLDAMLAEADAVIAGGASVDVSGGVIPTRNRKGVSPTWILMTNRGFGKDAAVWNHPEVPKWLAGSSALDPTRRLGAAVSIEAASSALPEAVVARCLDAGFERVLLFGGGRVNRMFYNAGLVDELVLTVCPVIVGKSSGVPVVAPDLESPVLLTLNSVRTEMDMTFIHYLVRR